MTQSKKLRSATACLYGLLSCAMRFCAFDICEHKIRVFLCSCEFVKSPIASDATDAIAKWPHTEQTKFEITVNGDDSRVTLGN